MRLRRSCLAVPGSNPKMLAKAAALPADMVFLDLEDAVAPLEKNDATRQNVVDALTGHEWTAPTRVVRVNGIDTTWCFRDILYVVAGARDALDCIMLPKVQGPDHVAFAHHLLTQLEAELGMHTRIGLEIQIESARGAENLPAIADASDRIETIIFGPGDYAADLGIPQLSVGAHRRGLPGRPVALHPLAHRHHRTRARLAGHRRPLRRDPRPRRLPHVAERSARLGCDGKWALHPDQIEILNEVYRPTQAQYDRAEALLDAYRQATEGDRRGAVMWEGEMIDEASRKMAEQVAARGRAAGMAGG